MRWLLSNEPASSSGPRRGTATVTGVGFFDFDHVRPEWRRTRSNSTPF
jgi:hypothetical protein